MLPHWEGNRFPQEKTSTLRTVWPLQQNVNKFQHMWHVDVAKKEAVFLPYVSTHVLYVNVSILCHQHYNLVWEEMSIIILKLNSHFKLQHIFKKPYPMMFISWYNQNLNFFFSSSVLGNLAGHFSSFYPLPYSIRLGSMTAYKKKLFYFKKIFCNSSSGELWDWCKLIAVLPLLSTNLIHRHLRVMYTEDFKTVRKKLKQWLLNF